MKKKTGYEYYTNRHSCFLLQYHIVLVTKYRHPVLTGDVKTAVYERINYVAESRGFNILELNGELDHIHLLIEADPQTSPSELVNYWKPYFWSDSYFIATVSENTLDVVKNYIKNQGIK